MNAPRGIARFDRVQLDPARLREIAKTADGRRFIVDRRAELRMERDRIEARAAEQLAEFDGLLNRLAAALDGESK